LRTRFQWPSSKEASFWDHLATGKAGLEAQQHDCQLALPGAILFQPNKSTQPISGLPCLAIGYSFEFVSDAGHS
jgi:hypothetical protein